MDLQVIVDSFIRHMELNQYPAELVNRRAFTYQRYVDSYIELSSKALLDFYLDHEFLRPHSHCLVQMDLLAWLRYMEHEGFN